MFKELHLNMPIEFPDDLSYVIDEKGEKVKCRNVSNDISFSQRKVSFIT